MKREILENNWPRAVKWTYSRPSNILGAKVQICHFDVADEPHVCRPQNAVTEENFSKKRQLVSLDRMKMINGFVKVQK